MSNIKYWVAWTKDGWSVWRMDEDGRRRPISSHVSEYAANLRMTELRREA